MTYKDTQLSTQKFMISRDRYAKHVSKKIMNMLDLS